MNRFEAELRAEITGNRLTGYAAVFGQVSYIGQIRSYERIEPGAFDAFLASPTYDTQALVNHNKALVLGSLAQGSLRMSTDSTGLHFEVDLPERDYGLRDLVAAGEVRGASFGFIAGDEAQERNAGRSVRVLRSFRQLLDVSPAFFPAYSATSVDVRNQEISGPSAREQAALIRARVRGAR
jgi:HK97 family phage prohead protease